MTNPGMDDDIYNGFIQHPMEKMFFEAESQGNFEPNFGPMTADIYSRGNLMSATTRLATADKRPSTAVRPVGYTSEVGHMFDPLIRHKTSKKTIVLEKKNMEPHEKYKHLETKIQQLVEESILMSTGPNPNYVQGLNRAKEASSLDRTLLRFRDQNSGTAYHNFDLTYTVFFNLANLYTKNEMYVEAINTYSIMTKNKMFPNVNRLKVNIGNIYFRLGNYQKAIKMYRMALDQVPNNQKELRLKITHNIGILFIKLGQYSDAAASFDYIMSERPDIKSGMHLVLSYYAIGDIEKMKKAFRALVDVQLDYDESAKMQGDVEDNQNQQYVLDSIRNDELGSFIAGKKKYAEKCIVTLVDLISGIIEETYNEGYVWCIESIKTSNFANLANELELNKALVYLRQNDVSQAIETLRFYEKKEPQVAANAVTNLTFIYLKLGDLQNATKYAEICRKIDSYNPAAFVNSGVCEFLKGNFDMAKQYLEAALEIDMTSFEATYNLGLVYKRLGDINTAAGYFHKIKQNLSHSKHPHVYYQIASIHEAYGEKNEALDFYLQLLGIHQEMDPGIHQKVGEIYESYSDRQEANQYYSEAFRLNPSDIKIAASIGSYFIQLQAAEKAVYYYERAVLAHPNEPNLMLRVASCFRHIYSPRKYLQLFEDIYARFPENLGCLRALIHVTQSQGMTELYEKYTGEYKRLERILQTRQRINSGTGASSGKKTPQRIDTAKSSRSSAGHDFSSLKSISDSQHVDSLGSGMKYYTDPLGPPSERPRTGQVPKTASRESDDDLDADELLPI